jgi:hypothetical protein
LFVHPCIIIYYKFDLIYFIYELNINIGRFGGLLNLILNKIATNTYTIIIFFKRYFGTIINNCKDFLFLKNCTPLNSRKRNNYKSVLLNKSKPINTSPPSPLEAGRVRSSPKGFSPKGKKNNIINKIFNIISYTFLVFIIYFFIWDLRMSDFFQIFIFSIFSFAISIFISEKFKFSNNKFIKILQKLVFTNIILALFGFIGYLLDVSIFNIIFCENDDEIELALPETQNPTTLAEGNIKKEKDILHITSNTEDKEYYSFKIKKEVIDNIWEKGTDLIMSGVKDLGPNLGIGAAVGKIGSEIIKHTAGMAPAPRIAMVGTTALATAAGTKIGIELGKALIENKKRDTEIEANKLDTVDISGRNSPTEFDGGFIHSVLDTNEIEIPLLTMVNGLCYLNYIEFILILGLFSLLFLRQSRKYLIRKLIGFILKKFISFGEGSNLKKKKRCNRFVLKYSNKLRISYSPCLHWRLLLAKSRKRGERRLNKKSKINSYKILSLNNTLKNVDKYTDYLTVFIFVCLFWIKFINIYFSSNLAADIDSFVNVYNHIKNNIPPR